MSARKRKETRDGIQHTGDGATAHPQAGAGDAAGANSGSWPPPYITVTPPASAEHIAAILTQQGAGASPSLNLPLRGGTLTLGNGIKMNLPPWPVMVSGCPHFDRDWDDRLRRCRACGTTAEQIVRASQPISPSQPDPEREAFERLAKGAANLRMVLAEQQMAIDAERKAEAADREARRQEWVSAWERAWADYRAAEEPPVEKAVPRHTEPVYGFRWFEPSRGWKLKAVYRYGEWKRGDNRKDCTGLHPTIPPPHSLFGCQCGFYAYHSPQVGEGIPAVVIGWGDVAIHDNEGWRSEYARIVALLSADATSGCFATFEVLKSYAETYGVPVIPWNEAVAFAREHGVSAKPLTYPLLSRAGAPSESDWLQPSSEIRMLMPLEPAVRDSLYSATSDQVAKVLPLSMSTRYAGFLPDPRPTTPPSHGRPPLVCILDGGRLYLAGYSAQRSDPHMGGGTASADLRCDRGHSVRWIGPTADFSVEMYPRRIP